MAIKVISPLLRIPPAREAGLVRPTKVIIVDLADPGRSAWDGRC